MPTEPQDDFAASILTKGTLALGKPAQGVFELPADAPVGDSDWFKVQLTAGQTYVFNLDLSDPIGLENTELALRDATGKELLVRKGLAGAAPAFEFTPTTTGTYFVDARTLQSFIYVPGGGYQVNMVLKPAGDDFTADTKTTGKLVLDKAATAVINHAGDADWFSFAFEAGKTYALAPAMGNEHPVQLSIVDANGVTVAAPGSAFTPSKAGTYYVNATGLTAGAYGFTLSVPTDDYASTTATTGKLTAGATSGGILQYIGDSDWFKVRMEANTFYVIELAALPSEDYIKLMLMKPNGTPMDFSTYTDPDGNARIVVRADTTGDYFANVAYGSYTGGLVGRPYVLTMQAGPVDDVGDTAATAKVIKVGESLLGQVTGPGDTDVFKMTMKAGVTYAFSLDGLNADYISVAVQDASGNEVQRFRDKSLASFTPKADGLYSLHLSSDFVFPMDRTLNIIYKLSAALALDDFEATAAGAGRVAVGSTVKGALQPGLGDRDWIAVDLQAGKTYTFSLKQDGADQFIDNAIKAAIVDARGVVLKSVTGYDLDLQTFNYRPTTSGTYYFEIGGDERAQGSYTLSVALGKDDTVGETMATAGRITTGVVTHGVLEVAGDVDMYRVSPPATGPYVVQIERAVSSPYLNFQPLFYSSTGREIQPTMQSTSNNILYYYFNGDQDISYVSMSNNQVTQDDNIGFRIKLFQPADDYANNTTSSGRLQMNGSSTGVLEVPGDRDYFKVKLEAGKKYSFDLYGAAGGGGTLNAANNIYLLTVRTPGGEEWSQPDSGPSEARHTFTAKTSGDHFIIVGSSHPWVSGSYTVGVTELTGDTARPTLASGLPAQVGLAADLTLTFSEQVKVKDNAFSIHDSAGRVVFTGAKLDVQAEHKVVTIDPSALMQPGQSYTLQLAQGALTDLAGNAYTGQSSWTFSTPAGVAQGSTGNDMLVSSGKGAAFDGGAGIDMLVSPLSRHDVKLIPLPDGRLQVQPLDGTASDVLANVERILFSNIALALDYQGTGGQAYRLFSSALPYSSQMGDSGIGAWIDKLDKGLSPRSMAESLLGSAEYVRHFGTLSSNSEFVQQMYQFALRRTADPAEISYWAGAMDKGFARADVLLAFANSAEGQAAMAPLVGQGFFYTPV